MLVMFNSTDLKNDNNSRDEHRDGDPRLQRWYTRRDIARRWETRSGSRR